MNNLKLQREVRYGKMQGKTDSNILSNIFYVLVPFLIYIVIRLISPFFFGSLVDGVVQYLMGWYMSLLLSITMSTLIAVGIVSVIYLFFVRLLHLKTTCKCVVAVLLLAVYAFMTWEYFLVPSLPEISVTSPIDSLVGVFSAIKNWLFILLLIISQVYVVLSWFISHAVAKIFSGLCMTGVDIYCCAMAVPVSMIPFAGGPIAVFTTFLFTAIAVSYLFMLNGMTNLFKNIVDASGNSKIVEISK